MTRIDLNQWLNTEILGDDVIQDWAAAFISDKKLQNVSARTIEIYQFRLYEFLEFLKLGGITHITQITPNVIRAFLVNLESQGHNPGGINIYYRVIKTFLRWYEFEAEPEGWKNPIRKVKAPKIAIEPLEPVTMDDVEKIIATCDSKTFYDLRDKGIMLFLLDTGCRASEACNVNLGDVDLIRGSVLIRHGKGGKYRTVFIGKKTRKAIRNYLRIAKEYFKFEDSPLFISQSGEGLTYWGLNEIIKRRSKQAGIEKIKLHSFRRAFAINALRSGMDMENLRRLMGHSSYQVLQRYLREVTDDLRVAHHKHSPVDNNL